MIKDLNNLEIGAHGYPPGSGHESGASTPIKVIVRAHNLSGHETPELFATVADARTHKTAEVEYGVWLTIEQAASLHTWLGRFLSAARAKEQ